ncbi:partial Secretory immunoglobulin A-binding protein EsiB, partial [Methylacidimicrobium cyclopophantes]
MNLALLYDRGLGIRKDRLQAARWYEREAEQGVEQAQWRLGTLLLRYGGVPCNPGKGLCWLRRAAEAGPSELRYGIGGIYEYGWALWSRREQAPFWAGRGTGRPPPPLGFPFSELELRPDSSEARRWYRLATENSHAEAGYRLGLFLEEGLGGASDPAAAALWYRRAAESGAADAQYRLGRLYEQGLGVARELPAAVRWYEEAARKSQPAAARSLGKLFLQRRGGKPDSKAAAAWLLRAAKGGMRKARSSWAFAITMGGECLEISFAPPASTAGRQWDGERWRQTTWAYCTVRGKGSRRMTARLPAGSGGPPAPGSVSGSLIWATSMPWDGGWAATCGRPPAG